MPATRGASPSRARRRRPVADPKAAVQDWLTLVDPDGAFLTPSELHAAFPDGFISMPAPHRAELRSRVADLDGNGENAGERAELRRWLLDTVLEWDDLLAEGQQIPATAAARAPEHGVELRPDEVLLDVDDESTVRVGVFVWPEGTRLDRRADGVTGDGWPATPVQRAETWCREAGIPLALVTDDDQWVLVWAPRQAPSASCRWGLPELADEKVLQNGLVSLLEARRFFAVDEDTTLERLFERAADAEAEITKGLGLSVRRSVELLVAALSRDDVATGGEALRDAADEEVYEAAVTVLMRLVFLLFAEERRLLPSEDPLWAESYSVLTLRQQLREAAAQDSDETLERRASAWHRLLATFRAVHGGAYHDRLTLPAYGGGLFDPERFPFLEGRRHDGSATDADRPVAIDDRTVLAVLDALLTIEVASGRSKVAQRVSYKALDVEQIGHCYEGLLDHGCLSLDDLTLGLVGRDGDEPEISLADLDARRADGVEALCEWLADKERCAKKASALAKLLDREPTGNDLARLRVACGNDDETLRQVQPYWGLLRLDLRGLPVVLLPGFRFVTQTSTRRNTGAQYTTKALATEVVEHTLAPLVHDPGPQHEADPARWRLRSPEDILGLRVCDPAVGSGAILTAAGRYLADRLIESVSEYGPGRGRFADRLAELAAATPEDQVVLARREVVDHCLYGVDKNPVAAEMAKLSLWLTTMARERPFTFLDHAIQTGDSLLGITDLDQLRWLHLDPDQRQRGFEGVALDVRVAEAVELARRLQRLSVVTVRDAAEKRRLHNEVQAMLADLRVVADAVVGAGLSTAGQKKTALADRLNTQIDRIHTMLSDESTDAERRSALEALLSRAEVWLHTDMPDDTPVPWERRCLHWPLAFPEVFLEEGRTGFDAVVANPPFLGGKRISGASGGAYREHLVSAIADGVAGNADLSAYFLLRMCALTASVGTLATNTISQGDTREVALDRLTAADWVIHRAVKTAPWPNDAGVEVAKVWLWGEEWDTLRWVDGRTVAGVTPALEAARRVSGPAHRLEANADQSFIGSFVNGIGFVITPDLAHDLMEKDDRNADVLSAYLNGADLNDDPEHRASRWIVNFHDWPLEKAELYPDCLDIVKRLVKPERDKVNRKAHRERWWMYGDKRPALYSTIAGMDRVLAIALTSKTVTPAFQLTNQVFSHMVGVFAYDDDAHFGLLTSALHWWWAVTYASTLETRIRYTPSDVFETFPQPEPQSGPRWEAVDRAGRELNEFRADLMVRNNQGLTKTYNRVHNPDERDPDIARLRELHVALDHAVLAAYGWDDDIPLDHHHWETPQGVRFTVGPASKDELLDRLLQLNHERYADEVAAGLHDEKKPKKGGRKAGSSRGSTAPNPDQERLL